MQRPLIFETDDYGYVTDERVKWFGEFRDLSQEQMTYVAWTVDYNSPYYGNPAASKQIKIKAKIFKERGVDIEHSDTIQIACELYSQIQYDPIAEQMQSAINLLDVYTRDLNKLSAMGTSKQEVDKIDKAVQIQQKMEKEIERLEEKQRRRITEDSKTRGDRVTNFYEKLRKNKDITSLALEGIQNYLDARP